MTFPAFSPTDAAGTTPAPAGGAGFSFGVKPSASSSASGSTSTGFSFGVDVKKGHKQEPFAAPAGITFGIKKDDKPAASPGTNFGVTTAASVNDSASSTSKPISFGFSSGNKPAFDAPVPVPSAAAAAPAGPSAVTGFGFGLANKEPAQNFGSEAATKANTPAFGGFSSFSSTSSDGAATNFQAGHSRSPLLTLLLSPHLGA